MRTGSTLCALALAFTAPAQEGTFQVALDPPGSSAYVNYTDAALFTDGSVVLMAATDPYPSGAALVTKLDAAGNIIWSRHLEPSNSAFVMRARRVVGMPDGGAAMFARITTSSEQYCIVRLDASGNLAWAHLYLPASIDWYADYGYSTLHPMPDGGLMVNLGRAATPTFMRLDPAGAIQWSRSFITTDPDTLKNPTFDFDITDDGNVLVTEKANSDMMLVMVNGADGQAQWSHRYGAGGSYTHTKTARELANGDLLVAGYTDYMPFAARLTSTGTLLWKRNYDLLLNGDGFQRITELANGEILLSARVATFYGGVSPMSEVMLRISSTGMPLGLMNASTQMTNPSMELIGEHDGTLLFGGQATMDIDGGYDEFHLLWKVDEQLNGACGFQASSMPVTSSDLTSTITMTSGVSQHDQTVSLFTLEMTVSNAIYTAYDFCFLLTSVHENAGATGVNIYPSPVGSGGMLHIDLGSLVTTRIEVVATDGRLVHAIPTWGLHMIEVSTAGMNAGLYLMRALDARGAQLYEARIVVE